MASKRNLKLKTRRSQLKAAKLAIMRKPDGQRTKHPSKYAAKNRHTEILRGYSNRPNSPFFAVVTEEAKLPSSAAVL